MRHFWIGILIVLALATNSRAESLFSFEQGALKLALSQQAESQILLIKSTELNNIEISEVENPPRLVIDIAGLKIIKNISKRLTTHTLSAIRLGVHPEKLRVVLEFSVPSIPAYEKHQTTNEFELKFSASASSLQATQTPEMVETPSPGTNIPSASPTASATFTSSPTRSVTPTVKASATPTATPPHLEILVVRRPTPNPTQTHSPTASPTRTIRNSKTPTLSVTPTAKVPTLVPTSPTPTVTKISSSTLLPRATSTSVIPSAATTNPGYLKIKSGTNTLVEQISFDLGSNRLPSVSIELSKRAEYKLTSKDPGFFSIQIPSCGLAGKHLELPQFPTQEFVGFTVVLAKSDEKGCEISIGVDRGYRIETVWKDGRILAYIPNK